MLLGQQGDNVLGALFQQFLEAKHDPGPFEGGRLPPGWPSRRGRRNGFFHRGLVGHRHLADDLARGGVAEVQVALAIRHMFAVDVMADAPADQAQVAHRLCRHGNVPG